MSAAVSKRSSTSTVSKSIQIKKRSGAVVDYRRQKIEQAVKLCLINGCLRPNDEATTALATKATDWVDRLVHKLDGQISVEAIQDLVEQSLYAVGEPEAGRQYVLYREEHRKLRESVTDPKLQAVFNTGISYFTGANRDVQIVQAMDKFARFRPDLGNRREVWPETVDRSIEFFRHEIVTLRGMNVPAEKWEWLRQGLLTQQATPSMRALQLAGPALTRCNSGVNNCSYLCMDGPDSSAEDLYLLMQGCGVGFSVEYAIAIDKWPRVKRQTGGAALKHEIPDTTEGWCDAFKLGLNTWLDGGDVEFNFDAIRPEGTPLKIKGGTASGPGPLKDLLNFTRKQILAYQGGCLSSLAVHDFTCFAHRIVQMGGVRRASGISLSDLNDAFMRDCKSGPFWATAPHRNQANNSTAYNVRPSMHDFMAEWSALMRGGTGERGIFNREAAINSMPERRRRNLTDADKAKIGCNPCGEIIELDREFCNLSMAIARPQDTMAVLEEKIAMATAWGTMQSAMTRYNYLRPDWKANVEREHLLGVDILGHFDHYLIGAGNTSDAKASALRYLRDGAVKTNVEWARMLGIGASAAVTCNKPNGDCSVLLDTSAGFKAHHGKYFLRRLRFKASNPVAMVLKNAGVPWQPDYDGSGLLVFEFPCKAPVDNPIILGEKSAIEQLENWKCYKLNWTEQSPSVSVYVREAEWLAVGNWVWQNWEIVTGLSFFPFDDSHYPLAPYTTLTTEEYEQRAAAMPLIDWSKLTRYEKYDMTELKATMACSADGCAL